MRGVGRFGHGRGAGECARPQVQTVGLEVHRRERGDEGRGATTGSWEWLNRLLCLNSFGGGNLIADPWLVWRLGPRFRAQLACTRHLSTARLSGMPPGSANRRRPMRMRPCGNATPLGTRPTKGNKKHVYGSDDVAGCPYMRLVARSRIAKRIFDTHRSHDGSPTPTWLTPALPR